MTQRSEHQEVGITVGHLRACLSQSRWLVMLSWIQLNNSAPWSLMLHHVLS